MEGCPLEVTAVVVEGRGARDPAADLHAQLEEAKAAAMAAADRMQALLQQMAVMEAAAAERRLAELNVRAELNRQQLACGDQQAAASSTSRSVLVEPPQPQPAEVNAPTAEPRPDAKKAGVHQDERHHGITMADIFDDPDHKDEQAPIDTKRTLILTPTLTLTLTLTLNPDPDPDPNPNPKPKLSRRPSTPSCPSCCTTRGWG